MSSKKDNADSNSIYKFGKARAAGLLETTGITSRDQIIDPYDLVRVGDYGNNKYERAQYEQDLAQAIQIAERQEAAYQEWYNSESQQVARQKAIGLNPDLTGDIESGQASDVAAPQGSPMEGIPTSEQTAMQVAQVGLGALTSIAGVFTGVSSIMGTLSQIGLNAASQSLVSEQVDAQELANMANFEKLSFGGISDSLAAAISAGGDAFNVADFFADDSNFESIYKAYAPSDDPRYKDAFNRIRTSSRKIYEDAYSTLGNTEDNRNRLLSRMASRYYDPNDDIMTGQLRIMVNAQEELDLLYKDLQKQIIGIKQKYMDSIDVNAAAAGFNANSEASVALGDFNTDYYSAMQGEILGLVEQKRLIAESLISQASGDVYSWMGRKFNDSVGQNKQLAGWQILAGAHMGWQDYLLVSNDRRMQIILDNLKNLGDAASTNASLSEDRFTLDAIKAGASVLIPWIK